MSISTTPLALNNSGLAISAGQVSGSTAFRKFGANTAVPNTETPISSLGTIWQPTVATTVEAISGSANDTAAGSGARTIVIVGLNASFVEVSETLTMAGAVATAASANSYIRIYRAYVSSTGTYAGTNEGIITIRVSGAGTSIVRIALGLGQSHTTMYTVPTGYSLYVSDVHISASSTKAVDIKFFQLPNVDDVAASFTGAKRLVQFFDGIVTTVDLEYHPPMKFDAKTDLWFTGIVSAGTGSCSIEYVGTLVAS